MSNSPSRKTGDTAPREPNAKPLEGDFALDTHAAYLLRRAHQRASSVFLSILGESQLTPTQFFAMARLKEMGPLSQNRLGRLAAMDPATIQGVMRRLVERGFIERMPDLEDRRRMTLRLTDEGEALISELLGQAHQVDGNVLAPLTPSERNILVGLLKRLA